MFSFFKKQKKNTDTNALQLYTADKYETTISTENLVDSFDCTFYVISKPINEASEMSADQYTMANAIHVCVHEELAQTLAKDAENKFNCKYAYYKIPNYVLFEDILSKKAKAVIFYGISPAPVSISYSELVKQAEALHIFNVMYSTAAGKYYSMEQAYDLIKDNTFYFIGTIPPHDENGTIKEGTTFYLSEMERSEGENNYKALRCFVNKYSANAYGGQGKNIVGLPLKEIKSFYGGKVIIEPHRNWWLEF